ncbi:hypothetical protein P3T36_005208 [Kitasatospora sp. MAP12-15]|uniref:hypothetical protein n=1 Tax=unclassified Kitasatospora TaxID=2633591 RepID=UPI0024741515|nr:hypothetical protein [Kitasatospora sp. MAP12-44]MDH6113629.1 hypothetical protein [Kitasatospora sp. MAP12-44]
MDSGLPPPPRERSPEPGAEIRTDAAAEGTSVPEVDDDTISFYRWARGQDGGFDATDLRRASAETGLSTASCRASVDVLRQWDLLRPAGGEALVAAGPQAASMALARAQAELDRSEAELMARRERIEQTRTAVRSVVRAPARHSPAEGRDPSEA